MTEGPQQPYNPNQGWTAPPGPHDTPRTPGTPGQARQVLRGTIVGDPGHQPQRPARTPRAEWAPPLPGHGTRGPSQREHQRLGRPAAVEPDWAALADANEARARRRRRRLTGGGVLAVAAVAGVVATAVAGSGRPSVSPTAAAPSAPSEVAPPREPSFSGLSVQARLDPLVFISDREKDTAPLSVAGLFPGKRLVWSGRTYTRATAAKGKCSSAASADLAAVLRKNGCGKVLRVTYVGGEVAVTVGVAVFDDPSAAGRAKSQAKGYVRPLSGGGAGAFCHATSCRTTTNAKGRYAYFTIAGLRNNGRVTASDTVARQAGTDGSDYAFNRIVQRGRDQAAAATVPAVASPGH
ncbi:hypothetical protein [Streptomyces sp. MI02-7b]|uniref:hypothetical protein n=1 Tax=Streptomyces sp. MI02-7b TaxID=462941 RepID=UPI0029B3523C|nr:hypothetical protein [Streptomyces sp. MI02-7b]MDX3071821.1 hypothetical protein [Streptomyces sp. MI02-7b]